MKNNEQGNNLADFSDQITNVVKDVSASIVAIDARPRVATSGIIWQEGGIIVSTNHTIQRDEDITVALSDGRTAKASVVGRDAGTDLAVLKIEDEEIAKTLKAGNVAETSGASVGNIVLAVGRTSREGAATASFGIISQIGGAWRSWRGDEIERFIALDVAVILGFSGGALVNAGGEILGVNTSAFGRGLALTIPTETVNRVVNALLTKGRISKPYLGIGTQIVPLTGNLIEKLDSEQTSGLMILTVEAEGAAEKAGILIGDVLVAIDETPTLEPADVQTALWGKEAGNTVKAKIFRGGELREIEIVLGERPEKSRQGRERSGHRGWRRRGC